MKIKLSTIKLTQLNNSCIMLISKFLRVLKAHNGTELKLSDPGVVRAVIEISTVTSNTELKVLAKRLTQEIRSHLLGGAGEEPSFQVYRGVEKRTQKSIAEARVS